MNFIQRTPIDKTTENNKTFDQKEDLDEDLDDDKTEEEPALKTSDPEASDTERDRKNE